MPGTLLEATVDVGGTEDGEDVIPEGLGLPFSSSKNSSTVTETSRLVGEEVAVRSSLRCASGRSMGWCSNCGLP